MDQSPSLLVMPSRVRRHAAGILCCCAAIVPMRPLHAETPKAPEIAVFEFEVEDESASAAPIGENSRYLATLTEVTANVRKTLADSGKYRLVDTREADADAVKTRSLRHCDGCEAKIASQLGADLSMVGVVSKVEQIAYAVEIEIRDAATGNVVFARRGVFLGGPTEWSSGVRSLLKHELLMDPAKRAQTDGV